MLAPQLISNETSNLAEIYMSIRCCFDGGKQYNCIQSGAFQYRFHGAGLQVQHGPEWPLPFWQETTGTNPGAAKTQYTTSKRKKSEKDRMRKQSLEYMQVMEACLKEPCKDYIITSLWRKLTTA
jgi:hypothetical protein